MQRLEKFKLNQSLNSPKFSSRCESKINSQRTDFRSFHSKNESKIKDYIHIDQLKSLISNQNLHRIQKLAKDENKKQINSQILNKLPTTEKNTDLIEFPKNIISKTFINQNDSYFEDEKLNITESGVGDESGTPNIFGREPRLHKLITNKNRKLVLSNQRQIPKKNQQKEAHQKKEFTKQTLFLFDQQTPPDSSKSVGRSAFSIIAQGKKGFNTQLESTQSTRKLPLFNKIKKQKMFIKDKREPSKLKDAGTSPKEMFIDNENFDDDLQSEINNSNLELCQQAPPLIKSEYINPEKISTTFSRQNIHKQILQESTSNSMIKPVTISQRQRAIILQKNGKSDTPQKNFNSLLIDFSNQNLVSSKLQDYNSNKVQLNELQNFQNVLKSCRSQISFVNIVPENPYSNLENSKLQNSSYDVVKVKQQSFESQSSQEDKQIDNVLDSDDEACKQNLKLQKSQLQLFEQKTRNQFFSNPQSKILSQTQKQNEFQKNTFQKAEVTKNNSMRDISNLQLQNSEKKYSKTPQNDQDNKTQEKTFLTGVDLALDFLKQKTGYLPTQIEYKVRQVLGEDQDLANHIGPDGWHLEDILTPDELDVLRFDPLKPVYDQISVNIREKGYTKTLDYKLKEELIQRNKVQKWLSSRGKISAINQNFEIDRPLESSEQNKKIILHPGSVNLIQIQKSCLQTTYKC